LLLLAIRQDGILLEESFFTCRILVLHVVFAFPYFFSRASLISCREWQFPDLGA
jgi:hypothetical protein